MHESHINEIEHVHEYTDKPLREFTYKKSSEKNKQSIDLIDEVEKNVDINDV